MIIKADSSTFFVFDLDDTLYTEIDYLKSAYRSISIEMDSRRSKNLYQEMLRIYSSGGNAFKYLLEKYPEKNLTIEKLLSLYRNHYPEISLREGVLKILSEIKKNSGKLGIITDGRSITQRNKIKALGLGNLIDKLVISEEFGYEKPSRLLYESFMEDNNCKQFYYIGDNLSKDFVTAKELSWCCIGILNSNNLNQVNKTDLRTDFFPHFFINKFTEIEII
jgi:putative hydrolase of the HAD superfamily